MKDKERLKLSIKSIEDLEKLKENKECKYVNIDITNPNPKIIDYLLTNGKNLSYTSMIEEKAGYIYIDYETFRKGQLLINEIIKSIPTNLTKLEKCKYLYVKLGFFIGYDINSIEEKNEILNLYTIYTVKNIWGCMSNSKGTNQSFTELFYHLCRLADIDCKIMLVNEYGYKKNIVRIDNIEIITDITKDIPYIQSGFQTRFFGSYNSDIELDRKIGYIKDIYNDKKLELSLKGLSFIKDDIVKYLLIKTQNIIKVANIQPVELGIIYNEIFRKFCPDKQVKINNLYIDSNNTKEHFILISYNGRHYSFNYSKNTFVEIKEIDLQNFISSGTIMLYKNEEIPIINHNKLKIA